MKITRSQDSMFRRYVSRFGRLTIARYIGGSIVIYPYVMGRMVGTTISRQEAADGLRKWRSLS